jgi:hypothetical protein
VLQPPLFRSGSSNCLRQDSANESGVSVSTAYNGSSYFGTITAATQVWKSEFFSKCTYFFLIIQLGFNFSQLWIRNMYYLLNLSFS